MSLRSSWALALLLVACASKRTEGPAPSPAVEPAPSTKTFRHTTDNPDADPGFGPPLSATADPNAPADAIAFAWKAPCEVPVRGFKYRSDKGSGTTKMHLVFEAHEGGYRLSMTDIEFEILNGQAIDTPELRAQVQQVLAMMVASMPQFLVSAEGEYVGLVGLEEMVEVLLTALGPDVPDGVAQAMRNPDTIRQLETVSGDYWDSWVGVWDGRTLRPGDTQVEARELGLLSGSMVVNTTVEHLGTVDGAPNLRLLRTHSEIGGEEARQMMLAQLRKIADQAGAPPPPDDAIGSMRRESSLYVTIDPNGAWPHRTRQETLIEVDDKRRFEVQEWEFDWQSAKGCR